MAKVTVFLGLFAMFAAGCASAVISDERIRSSTAGILGLSPDQVSIQDRRSDITNTYYVAKTARGDEYGCVISGSVLSAGMTNPPTCTKK